MVVLTLSNRAATDGSILGRWIGRKVVVTYNINKDTAVKMEPYIVTVRATNIGKSTLRYCLLISFDFNAILNFV